MARLVALGWPARDMIDTFAADDEAPMVTTVAGEIILVGEGVSVAYTPKAAGELANRLIEAVEQARRQIAGR